MNGHTSSHTIEERLFELWGYSEFRPMQREIIESVMQGHDTIALMPTGGGKSLTYQLPAVMADGLTIVITPLIALMKDQVDQLRRRGIPAVAIHSGLDSRRIEVALDNCTYGDMKLLYVAPERLATEAFRARLRHMNISYIAVDEAHCISQWGYDFRPSYLKIAELRTFAPKATILALTASATDVVARDIMHHLAFKTPNIIRTSFARPNISYVVRNTDDKYAQLLRVINNVDGSGIIYVRTREGTEQIAERLQKDGINAKFYHAGLPSMERALRQDEWYDGRVRVMVATNAFGMGIDKADVRFVVHYAMCESLEAYYQEAGRAGRDGKRSYALMLCGAEDADIVRGLIKSEFPDIATIKQVYEQICNYLQITIGDGAEASFPFNIYEFCHRVHRSSYEVVGALKILEQNGLMTLLDEQDNPAKLMFTCSRDELYKVNAGGNDMDLVLRTILRTYNGVFSHFRTIDELYIATHAGLKPERVHEMLKILWRMQVIRYIPSLRSPMIYLDSERLPTSDLFIAPETYYLRHSRASERFEAMMKYATSESVCRSQIISNYFGDNDAQPCGVCDICRSKRAPRTEPHALEASILELLRNREMTIKELVATLNGDAKILVERVNKMIHDEKISMDIGGKLKINK